MTEMKCLHCSAEVTNGLALCELCQQFVKTSLPYLQIYFGNLARWKPGRAGARPVPGSREPRGASDDGRPDRVSQALDEASNVLTTWARCLADDRPGRLAATIERILTFEEERCFRLLCALFERRVMTLATLGWAGEFVRAMAEQEATLRRLTERVVPGWYAGACGQLVGFDGGGAPLRCSAPTYVVPGLSWVTCGRCGATTYARDHLETILDESRGWVARPKRLAEALVALLDTEMSVPKLYTRIRQWAHQEAIKPVHHLARGYAWDETSERFVVADLEVGHARYRLGDVMDLALTKTRSAKATRAS